jgi:hypothetical protein
MAGLIKIDEDRSWSAATWVFDLILRRTRPLVTTPSASKIVKLIDQALIQGLEYLPLTELSATELSLFREAVEKAYVEIEAKGSSSFSEPSFYAGFMDRFKELVEMIRETQGKAP